MFFKSKPKNEKRKDAPSLPAAAHAANPSQHVSGGGAGLSMGTAVQSREPAATSQSPHLQKATFGPDKQLMASFGQIVSLLVRTPGFQELPLSSLRIAVMPAVGRGHFMIAEGRDESSGQSRPLAAVLWVSVSDEVDQRLVRDRRLILQLGAADSTGGDNAWITIAAGDQSVLRKMVDKLRETALAGRVVKLFAKDVGGNSGLVTLEPKKPQEQN